MMFKVKWGDIASDFKKRIMVNNGDAPIKFYFEDLDDIKVFIKTRDVVMCAVIPRESIENPKEFKMEYLADSFELQENPIQKKLGALYAQY